MANKAKSGIALILVFIILITLLSGCGSVNVEEMLYGEWTYTSTEGLPITYNFGSNGKGTYTKKYYKDKYVYREWTTGVNSGRFSYSVGDGKIVLTGDLNRTLNYTISGNTLHLFTSDGTALNKK